MNAPSDVRRAPAASPGPLARVWLALGSLRCSVVILLLFGVLTFAGTLAQKDLGLFVVQRDFFESFWVRWDTGVSVGSDLVLKLPLPGGYLLMLLMFVNLMVGGVVRLKKSARNLGILVTHLGMALLLVAGFVKLHYSYAGHVALYEGKSTSTMVSFHEFELALLRQDGAGVVERTVHADRLAGAARAAVAIDDPSLPFSLVVERWHENCEPRQKGPMFDTPHEVVVDEAGTAVFLEPRPVDAMRERNIAGCYVTVTDRATGAASRGILWGADFRPFDERRAPFTFRAGEATWGLDLRRVTWDLPFAVRLDKFQKTDHPGTQKPKDFSSWVTVQDAGQELPVHIYMNHPLRRAGHVFFQTNWGPQPGGSMQGPPFYSVFEVSSNPSDDWPKWASYVILAGLLAHFLPKLRRYLRSSAQQASLPDMS